MEKDMERIKIFKRPGEGQAARVGLLKNEWKNLCPPELSSPTAGTKPEIPSWQLFEP